MIISPRCVEIDVSKRMLDIFDDAIGTAERIANAPQAITEQVARWRCGNVLVVFEATGVYDRELAKALHQAGVRYARINPARARDFAEPTDGWPKRMRSTRECLPASPAPWRAADQPPEPERNTLAQLAKRRDQLVQMRAQEKNRRSEAYDRTMKESIARVIDCFDEEVEAIEAAIKALIKSKPEISEQARLMQSAPGVGPVACMQLIAQMRELGQVGPNRWPRWQG